MIELLHYTFFQHALLGSFLASILCGIIGTYIVTRRLVFISGGIAHASLGGVGLGAFLGISPMLGATLFALFSGYSIRWLNHKQEVREDSAIAMLWTFGMSIGILCTYLSPSFMPELPSFLFGNILTVTKTDLICLSILVVIALVLFTFLLRPIVAVAFDYEFARSQRLPVRFIELLMMTLIALTIVSCLRIVGIVLVLSLLTVPQMTANLFSQNYKYIIWLSILIGYVDCLGGLALSYIYNVPSGASIIFVSILIYMLAKTIKPLVNRFITKETAR